MRISTALLVAGAMLSTSLIVADAVEARTARYDLTLSYGDNAYTMDSDLSRSDCLSSLELNRRYAADHHLWECVRTD